MPRRPRQLAGGDHQADRYDPIFQRTMEEYARHRGFVLDPAPVRTPTGKPHVERGTLSPREFLRGETWRDRRTQASARLGVTGPDAHPRHDAPWPLAVFETVERDTALLIAERFDPPRWRGKRAPRSSHQLRQGALLRADAISAAARRGDEAVRIYAHQSSSRRTRPTAGGRATDHADYPEPRAYTARSAADHPRRVARPPHRRFAAAPLAGTSPSGPQAQRPLLSGRQVRLPRVDGACQRAPSSRSM